jgi:hypothetical protein
MGQSCQLVAMDGLHALRVQCHHFCRNLPTAL